MMKKILLLGILISFVIFNQVIYAKKQRKHLRKHLKQVSKKLSQKDAMSVITCRLNGGRFGDNLLSYSRTKWLAEEYGMPLLYKPFQYSDKLALHQQEKKYTRKSLLGFKAIRYLDGSRSRKLDPAAGILYIKKWYYKVSVDWKNETFVKKIKELIKPTITLPPVKLPNDCVTVALHVRRGGGYRPDSKRLRNNQPLRFAPDKFYIEQLKRIAAMFPGKNLYVHIFTDDRNPQRIVENFKREVNIKRITYDCRGTGNNHSSHVLEDFFAMMAFDCLIRSESNYSRFVERLGNNKLIISPVHFSKNKREKVIDIIRIRQLTDSGWKIKKIKLT